MHNYTRYALIAFLLYFVLIIPGIIANDVFYNAGNRLEQVTGCSIPGVGKLRLMRQIFFFLFLVVLWLVGATLILVYRMRYGRW